MTNAQSILEFQSNVSLKGRNTFGIAANAKRFAEVTDESALQRWANEHGKNERPFILGGGSNLLLTADIAEPVLHIAPLGIRVVEQDAASALVEAMAGEPWHAFVLWTLERGLCGLENLSLIPGYVGAGPVQNIGAYGVEIKERCERVVAVDLRTGELKTFSRGECAFGYRDSIFKHLERDRYAITRVYFRLSKTFSARVTYGDIQSELAANKVASPTARDVSNAVIAIRSRKLPDPAVIGNAGSFFQNPVVSVVKADELSAKHPTMARYPAPDGVKLAAGWLIEHAGWKGRTINGAGVHEKHALVLVNHGGATGASLWQLAQMIQVDVLAKFGVQLEAEPRVV
ncbi:MAG: UDP-N-acetylmuramate dehydrogenase [Betaproteobacteria bacterium]|nr:MAG: UDP-N-acetylmuramate dehydrogenase [Betaproteobacteria bacterium]